MARNVFALDPVEYELERQQAEREGRGLFEAPKPAEPKGPALTPDGDPDFGKLAVDHQVPRNIIIALTDAAGLKDPQQKGTFATEAASRIGRELQAGKDPETALRSVLGDDAPVRDLLDAAKKVPDYQRIGAEEGAQTVTDADPESGRLGKAFQQGEAQAITMGKDGSRRLSAALEEGVFGRTIYKLRQKLGVETDTPEERAEAIRNAPASAGEQQAQGTLKALQDQGFEVMSWKDIRGIASAGRFIAENTAMALPYMGAGMAAGPVQPQVMMPMLAGEVFSELDEKMPDLPEQQKANVAAGAGAVMWAFETIGLGSVVGKMLPSDIAARALRGELADTLMKRGIKRSAARMIEAGVVEGSTEAIQEGIIIGATASQGGEYTRDEITERLTAAFAGGGGAGAGLRGATEAATLGGRDKEGDDTTAPQGGPQQVEGRDAPPALEAQPAPAPVIEEQPPVPQGPIERAAQDAPGMLAGDMEEGERITITDGTGRSFDAEFVQETPNGIRVRDEGGPFLIPRADLESGNLSLGRAQRQPQGVQLFPDMKPGSEVRLQDADGRGFDAVFLREDQNGVAVRIAGQEVQLTPQEFDQARAAAMGQTPDAGAEADTGTSTDAPNQLTQGENIKIDLPPGVDPDEFEERAAILEQDAGLSREEAETQALDMILQRMEEDAQRAARGEIPDTRDMAETGQVRAPEAPQGAAPVAPQAPVSVEGDPEQVGAPDADAALAPSPVDGGDAPETATNAPDLQAEWWRSLPRLRKAAKDLGLSKEGLGEGAWTDKNALIGAVDAELQRRGDTAQQSGQGSAPVPPVPAPEATPVVDQAVPESEPQAELAGAGEPEGGASDSPTGVDYPNRKLNMRYAKADTGPDGMGDMDPVSFGNIALANMQEGDVVPRYGTVKKVTAKQIQFEKEDGKILRVSVDTPRFEGIARDLGDLISAVNHIGPDRMGNVLDAIERDPAFSYKDSLPQLHDDPAMRGSETRPQGPGGALKPLSGQQNASTVEEAAAETDTNPTDAQKEAENYKTGKVQWNGLTLSIENPKGSERRKTGPDGQEWSVTMPAHYGRILRTEGADGDHVDFYMGDVDSSDAVVIVNQVDPETMAFDEHKVILGTTARGAALKIYRDGFSDGSGDSRIGSFSELDVGRLKAWLADGDLTKPTQPISMPFVNTDSGQQAEPKKPKQKTSIDDVIEAAKRSGHAPETANLVPVQDWLIKAARKIGLELDGFSHTLDGSAVRHILKSHGNAGREAARGNILITETDIENIPTVLGDPDFLVLGSKSRQGKDQIAYLKKMDDGSTLYFEEVRTGRKRLAALTMRKYPATTSSDSILSALRLDARSDGGDGQKVILSGAEIKKQNASENDAPAETPTTGILSSLSEDKQRRAEELKKRLADKVRNQTSSGLDPEYITLGGELVALYIEAGTKRFAQMLRDFAETTGLPMREAQAPMRAAYNHVRDDMDLAGQDVSDMDDAQAVMAEVRRVLAEEADGTPESDQQAAQDASRAEAPEGAPQRVQVGAEFANAFREGRDFKTIVQARAFAEEVAGEKLSNKDVEEAIEAGLVMRAREIAAQAASPSEAYGQLVDLYKTQPNLATRTSESVEQQAYSTPAPLAYLASRLADVRADTSVYEPSAGNGMLLLEADPDLVTANELNDARFSVLNALYDGAKITQQDGAAFDPDGPFDRIIANPPFGKVKDEALRNKRWPMGGTQTSEIDHAISWKALSSMKDNGRAVLIIGGIKADTDAERANGYKARGRNAFYTKLYDQYNVTEHFTVAGDLYKRQGAAWPVDVIVIEGRGQSAKPYPYVSAPALYSDWGDFGRRLTDGNSNLDPRQQRSGDRNDRPQSNAGDGADQGPLRGGVGQQDQQNGSEGAAGSAVGGRAAGPDQRGAGPDGDTQSGRSDGGNERGAAPQERDAGSGVARPDQRTGGERGGSARADEPGSRPDGPDGNALRRVERAENTETETDYQVRYQPHSNSRFAVGTLVPRNMQSAIDRALGKIKQRIGGDIDKYVADKLGYTVEEVTGTENADGYFSAEQVDALAMAIDNVEQGAGFVIGDQTGVGKGRFVAAMLRYATLNGMTPVFVTKQPGLFADMVRDLRDIGEKDAEKRILTSQPLRGKNAVPLSNDPSDVLRTPSDTKLKAALAEMQKTGRLPEGYDMFFTTYSQLQYKAGSSGALTPRQKALNAIAPNAMMVLDESHEAGGTETRQIDKETGEPKPTRADYVRQVLQSSRGAVYSSATYAKNPTVMSLYNRTDLQYAVEDMDDLADTVRAGGVPLQQIMANMLVESGQYGRRERSFEGVSMEEEVFPTDIAMAETSSRLMAGVFNLDRDYMEELREAFLGTLEERGLLAGVDRSVGEEAAGSSTGFANVMHNVVNQALFSLKAEAVAQKAIDLHKKGEKPLIAVTHTNESLLEDYIADTGLAEGDAVDMQFNVIFERYLSRLRRVTVKDSNGKKHHFSMSDRDISELGGPEALSAVKAIEKQVREADLSSMPAMPLDYVYDRLSQAGLKVDEITGRQITARGGKITRREASDAAKKRAMNGFNAGSIDAVILNKSGSTGFSLHATGKDGNDGKPRHMLILQPDPNIDTFMQMLGRIHRTGQIKLPSYTIAVSDLALEKRVSANLMKKMASLNANTTASKSSAVSLDSVVDFLNKYGDQVVNEILRDDAELASRINVYPKQKGGIAGLAGKVTGRLSLLQPSEVEEVYDRISEAYIEFVDALDKMGMNTLEAKTLDLRAITNNKEVLEEGKADGDSPFMQDAFIETVSVRKLGKPYTMDELKAEIEKVTDGDPAKHVRENAEKLDALLPDYITKMEASLQKARDRLAAAKTDSQKKREDEAVTNWQSKINNAQQTVREVKEMMEELRPGKFKAVTLADQDSGQERTYEAIPVEISTKSLKDNPTALSQIKVRFAIADASREVWVPFSKLMDEDAPFTYRSSSAERVKFYFENGQSDSRENRQMITGNVVSGFAKLGQRGQIVMFTRDDGSVEHGVMLPRDFDVADELAKKPVVFTDPEHVAAFLDEEPERRMVQDDGGVATITHNGGSRYTIKVQNRGGKPFYLNPAVRKLVGDFEGRGKGMTARFSGRDTLKQVIEAYQTQLGAKFITESSKDEARAITGEKVFGEDGADDLKASRRKPVASLKGGEQSRAGGAEAKFSVATDRVAEARSGQTDSLGDANVAADGDSVNQITSKPEARKRMRKLAQDMRDELRKVGISGRITLDLRDELIQFPGMPGFDGYFLDGVIGVNAKAPDGAMGILRHEIIHALRNKRLWGKDYGLFTQEEWRVLVRAARKNQRIMDQVRRDYPDLNAAGQTEEAIAEMFREWMDARETQTAAGKAMDKLRRMIEAIVNALRGNDMNAAAEVFDRIRTGEIGGRGPDGPGGGATTGQLQGKRRGKPADPSSPKGVPVLKPSEWRKDGKQLWRDALTDAMGGGTVSVPVLGDFSVNSLSLVPGRPLFEELGRNLPSAQHYLKLKEEMDALRTEWHATTDEVAQRWIKLGGRNTEANGQMMDLMHRSTLAGVDPSKPFSNEGYSKDAYYDRKETYDELSAEFDQLPGDFQRMFRKVRESYDTMADEFEKAVIENIEKAQEIAVKRAQRDYDKEMRRIDDEGLEGAERRAAKVAAQDKLDKAKARLGWARQARVAELRSQFESNRLKGPYFPLARFGKYFVAVRDNRGKVVSFSRFEKQRQQRDEAKRQEGMGYEVETGVLGESDADLKRMVDPTFVAEIESLMADWNVEPAVMDTVWQRWLETLPDQSIRKSRIHRKGRAGYSKDALRAFTHHVFHGAHQLARLKYGLEMEEAINDSYDEAGRSEDANRATLVVDEMKRRHQFTMNPTVSGWSTGLTSLAFIWYLGATPAAAMVNMTQTTVMGIPIMKAAFENTSITQIARQIARASRDFIDGRGSAEASNRLTDDEKAALKEAYRRGIVDRTQAHELAGVAETGIEYSGRRERVMRFFSYLFHKAEVFNREVTFLASYRLARAKGLQHARAIDRSGSVTWKTHFDYQGSSRARIMQGDWPRVLLIFRQHTVNVLYRLFRDTHEAFEGKTEADRREAKAQLVGITLSMMAHAGITGTWGYGLITMLMSMFFEGDDDDMDEWLHDALLMEGESPGVVAWNYVAGMALKGIPGQITGVDLTQRIGMPNLWFRDPFYDLEPRDYGTYLLEEIAGPIAGIGMSLSRGMQYLSEGDWWRGAESMVPKMANDLSQAVRYSTQGVLDKNGDPILENVSPYQALVQAMGFTPAQLSERYEDSSRMKDMEREIEQERRSLQREAGDALMNGEGLSDKTLKKIRAFNKAHPLFPITGETVVRSARSRQRWSEGKIDGVNINPKLRQGIEQQMAPTLYNR